MAPVTIARHGIDDVSPVLRAFHQLLIVTILTQSLGHLRHGEVIEGIFQGARGLLVLMEGLLHAILQGDIAILEITLQGAATHAVLIVVEGGGRLEGILPHTLVGLFGVEAAYTFYICISQDYRTVVANHRSRI